MMKLKSGCEYLFVDVGINWFPFLSLSDLTKDLPAPPTLPLVTEAPPNAEEPSKLQCGCGYRCVYGL